MDLIVTLDDATSEIYAMHLVDEEGTASTFAGLREVVAGHGLFCALYSDRGSHYFHTPKAGEKVSKTQLTQSGRARARIPRRHARRLPRAAPAGGLHGRRRPDRPDHSQHGRVLARIEGWPGSAGAGRAR